ncbi:MAG: hypothetical protein HC927_02905 [Deltaproteobacteria bacterium]|nr:hypothetical protein [Deltaproteobacteria bacterium]
MNAPQDPLIPSDVQRQRVEESLRGSRIAHRLLIIATFVVLLVYGGAMAAAMEIPSVPTKKLERLRDSYPCDIMDSYLGPKPSEARRCDNAYVAIGYARHLHNRIAAVFPLAVPEIPGFYPPPICVHSDWGTFSPTIEYLDGLSIGQVLALRSLAPLMFAPERHRDFQRQLVNAAQQLPRSHSSHVTYNFSVNCESGMATLRFYDVGSGEEFMFSYKMMPTWVPRDEEALEMHDLPTDLEVRLSLHPFYEAIKSMNPHEAKKYVDAKRRQAMVEQRRTNRFEIPVPSATMVFVVISVLNLHCLSYVRVSRRLLMLWPEQAPGVWGFSWVALHPLSMSIVLVYILTLATCSATWLGISISRGEEWLLGGMGLEGSVTSMADGSRVVVVNWWDAFMTVSSFALALFLSYYIYLLWRDVNGVSQLQTSRMADSSSEKQSR